MTRNKDVNMKLSRILLEEDQPTIEELQKQIQKLKDRNAYAVSLGDQQLKKIKSDVAEYLSTGLQREINALEDIAKSLDDKNKTPITMTLHNIKQILRDYLQ